jgi:hypothetical protein
MRDVTQGRHPKLLARSSFVASARRRRYPTTGTISFAVETTAADESGRTRMRKAVVEGAEEGGTEGLQMGD